MLDLSRVSGQVNAMTKEYTRQISIYSNQIENALEALDQYDENPRLWLEKINSDERHFFVAFPKDKLSSAFSLPDKLNKYTVMAVDGSQIDVDTHEIALCYVINIGRVVLYYGTGNQPLLDSLPKLYFKQEDIYRQQSNGQAVLIQGDRLAELRSQTEALELKKLVIDKRIDNCSSVAFVDGTLVSWDKAASAKKDIGGFTAPLFDDLFKMGERIKIPVAGYISGSRTSLVVNTLRSKDCIQSVMDCTGCKYRTDKEAPCHLLEGIRDTALFKNILGVGERSTVFYGGINTLPKEEWPKYRIGFFYINGGSEIARVEAPDYVLEDDCLMDLIHAAVFDQIQKGLGYPVALQEAHHLAVVKGVEREAFYHLVANNFAMSGIPIEVTDKKLKKNTRIF